VICAEPAFRDLPVKIGVITLTILQLCRPVYCNPEPHERRYAAGIPPLCTQISQRIFSSQPVPEMDTGHSGNSDTQASGAERGSQKCRIRSGPFFPLLSRMEGWKRDPDRFLTLGDQTKRGFQETPRAHCASTTIPWLNSHSWDRSFDPLSLRDMLEGRKRAQRRGTNTLRLR